MNKRHPNKQEKKGETIHRLKQMVTIPPKDIFTEINRRVKIAKIHNLSSAVARYLAEDDRVVLLTTLTFSGDYRFNIQQMTDNQILKMASMQYQGINSFLYNMRKTSKVKGLRYFAVFELQGDGNLHAHIQLSVPLDYLWELIETIHRFKKKHTKEYTYNKKGAYPVGRTHIGISARYKEMFFKRYKMRPYKRKALDDDEQSYFEKEPSVKRTEHYMFNNDARVFREGDWTPIEFYTTSLLEELHGEMIEKYLIKTLTGEFAIDVNSIKEGVLKARLSYDTKTLTEDNEQQEEAYITMIQIAFIRKICKQAYTHSRMPFPFKVYQTHRKALIAFNSEYKVFYNCIKAIRNGDLMVHKEVIYDVDGNIISKGINDES